jgi:hypothetical protein
VNRREGREDRGRRASACGIGRGIIVPPSHAGAHSISRIAEVDGDPFARSGGGPQPEPLPSRDAEAARRLGLTHGSGRDPAPPLYHAVKSLFGAKGPGGESRGMACFPRSRPPNAAWTPGVPCSHAGHNGVVWAWRKCQAGHAARSLGENINDFEGDLRERQSTQILEYFDR